MRESLEQNLQKLRGYATAARSPVAGGMALSGEGLDELVHLYEPTGQVGGYALKMGLPALTMQVEKRPGRRAGQCNALAGVCGRAGP